MNPSFIRALNDRVDEDTDYEQQIAYYKNIFVILLPVSKQHKNMLAHCKRMLEHSDGTLSHLL